jgi:thiosulfate/3-mercaptopyruvate sulfurtransferase
VRTKIVVIGAVAAAAAISVAPGSQARPTVALSTVPATVSAADPTDYTATGNPWRAEQVVEPATLAKELTSRSRRLPTVLYVGFPLLYAGGHIPGAHYLGPASTVAGLRALQEATKKLPADGEVVLYCGCCPMDQCPNIRPAFRLMEQLRFTNVKVLDIPVNFPHDWTRNGYPIETGGLPRGAQSS